MNYLLIGAHTDDIELCAGATMARLLEEGHQVTAITLCHKFDFGNLYNEWTESIYTYGDKLQSWCYDFQSRNFLNQRQQILDCLINARERYKPDFVITHSITDNHQDHSVVGYESLRAFKNSSIITYTGDWNQSTSVKNYLIKVMPIHAVQKLNSLQYYKSQAHRNYFNPDYIYGNLRVNGLSANCEFAEAFEVVRIKA